MGHYLTINIPAYSAQWATVLLITRFCMHRYTFSAKYCNELNLNWSQSWMSKKYFPCEVTKMGRSQYFQKYRQATWSDDVDNNSCICKRVTGQNVRPMNRSTWWYHSERMGRVLNLVFIATLTRTWRLAPQGFYGTKWHFRVSEESGSR